MVLITSMLPVLGVGVFSYLTTSEAFDKQIKSQVDSTADRKSQSVDDLIERSDIRLTKFTNRLQLRLLLDKYNESGGTETRLQIEQNLRAILEEESSFQQIYITNPVGNVVAATSASVVGSDYSKREEFIVGKEKRNMTIVSKDSQGVLRHRLVTPLTIDDRFIGVGVIDTQLDPYRLITSDYSGLGETGESYLIQKNLDGRYQYITPLRFKQNASFVDRNSGLDSKTDYSGHEVLRTTRNLSNSWVLVTEIDRDEVYAPVYSLQKVTVLIIALTLALVIIVAWYFSRTITLPIGRLISTVNLIRQGNLTSRVKVESKDEIGILGAAFNEMTGHLEESRARLLSSITGLKQGFIMVDKQGNTSLFNRSAQVMFELYDNANHNGANIRDVLSGMTGIDIEESLRLCIQDRKYVDVSSVKFNGAILRVFLSPIVVDNKITGAVILVVDETEAHILQRSRDEFFSIASHELRTPLTAIRGNASMIKSYFPDALKDPMLSEMIDDIHESSTRLIAIVNDFLDISRLEQDKINFVSEVFDISEVIEKIVYETSSVANEKNTHIEFEKQLKVQPEVYADKNRVKQIVYNLLGNALKFTEEGTVSLTLSTSGNLLKVTVTDSGPGISEEGQKLLFHKFQQAGDSLFTRDSSRGTGLGLYISKLLVGKMGGSITLEHSVLGEGSAFAFTVKLATEENKKAAEQALLAAKSPDSN